MVAIEDASLKGGEGDTMGQNAKSSALRIRPEKPKARTASILPVRRRYFTLLGRSDEA